jgi:hypothetical protein
MVEGIQPDVVGNRQTVEPGAPRRAQLVLVGVLVVLIVGSWWPFRVELPSVYWRDPVVQDDGTWRFAHGGLAGGEAPPPWLEQVLAEWSVRAGARDPARGVGSVRPGPDPVAVRRCRIGSRHARAEPGGGSGRRRSGRPVPPTGHGPDGSAAPDGPRRDARGSTARGDDPGGRRRARRVRGWAGGGEHGVAGELAGDLGSRRGPDARQHAVGGPPVARRRGGRRDTNLRRDPRPPRGWLGHGARSLGDRGPSPRCTRHAFPGAPDPRRTPPRRSGRPPGCGAGPRPAPTIRRPHGAADRADQRRAQRRQARHRRAARQHRHVPAPGRRWRSGRGLGDQLTVRRRSSTAPG